MVLEMFDSGLPKSVFRLAKCFMIAREANLGVGHLDKQSPIPVLEGHKNVFMFKQTYTNSEICMCM